MLVHLAMMRSAPRRSGGIASAMAARRTTPDRPIVCGAPRLQLVHVRQEFLDEPALGRICPDIMLDGIKPTCGKVLHTLVYCPDGTLVREPRRRARSADWRQP